MRTKVTLVLLFLNLALFFFIFHFERSWRTDRVAMEVRHRVLGSEAADIRALELTRAGGPAVRLERRGGDWFLTAPLEWRANPQAVNRIVSDLQFLKNETSFSVRDLASHDISLADYGLDHPALTVTFVSGGPDTTGAPAVSTTLRIGSAAKVGQRVYLLSGDESRIHVVDRAQIESLEAALDHQEQLRSDAVLTIPVFEAHSLNVQTPAGVRIFIQRDGGRWSFEYPIPTRANKDAIELTINRLDALRVARFIPETSAIPPPDQLRITIEGNNRRETLDLGEEVSPAAPASAAGREYYAQLEDLTRKSGRSPLFTVMIPPPQSRAEGGGDSPKDLLATLHDAPSALRDPHILVDLDPAAVTGIVLGAEQPDLTLQRIDQRGGWQIDLPSETPEPPRAADPEAVQRLLTQLSLLTARQFASDAPSVAELENWGFNQPERRLVLTLQPAAPPGPPGGPVVASTEITLEIGRAKPRDPLIYARLTNARSVYAIDPEILREISLSPLAWRDRSVQSLPAAATITGLKLTELVPDRVLLDWTPAARAVGLTDAQRTAANKLADELHHLKVARFTRAGFSEAGGGNPGAPWKYRLDETISLPGGGTADLKSVHSLWIAERTGGADQLAGAPEFGAVFALDQPMIDALWSLTYGARDPGEPAPAK
jgi:hypothetical protein